MRKLWVVSGVGLYLSGAGVASAALPSWDHIVVVIEENHSFNQVMGSASAPYINSLAASGANFTQMYAITHPSQPNYIQFYSGASQGVADNNVPAGVPFSTPNLGAAVLAAGRTFAGYSESLPSTGYNGATYSELVGQDQYMRKHNPWANWQSATPGVNQVPESVNQPFTNFPGDFTILPQLSIIVPNQQNNMHDGTIAQADTWLQSNVSAYATWAKTHNSLLVVTFDEDESASRNRIPTVMYGANVVTGVNSNTFTLHNLLHTLESTQGASRSGASNNLGDMFGSFTTDAVVSKTTFQSGVNGYTGTKDTYIDGSNTTTAHTSDTVLVVDGSPVNQALVRFDNIIGNGVGQVPVGATIVSAKLKILTGSTSGDGSLSSIEIHRMLAAWTDSSTYASLGSGVSLDGVEAVSAAEFTLIADELTNYGIFDVTTSLQAWANGATNYGWLLNDLGTDGWRWNSSEFATAADRPYLEVSYIVPEPVALPAIGLAGLFFLRRKKKS